MQKLKLLLILLLLITSCQKDKETSEPEPEPTPVPTGLITDQKIQSSNIERAYHLFVPEDYTNKPVVILLHGNGGSFNDLAGISIVRSPHQVWLRVAEENEFIVVIPNGTIGTNDKRGWNDCRSDGSGNPEIDDVQFMKDLLDQIKSDYDYDASRVYVTGTSNGGHLSICLAQEAPERIAAFAAIVAAMPENSECTSSSTPISALFMNGTIDPFLPYAGGEMLGDRGTVLSTSASIDYWLTRNEISASPVIEQIPNINSTDACTATKHSYKDGANNTEVVLYEITEGGHTEPSIEERYGDVYLSIVLNQNGDFEMVEEVWKFFSDKSK